MHASQAARKNSYLLILEGTLFWAGLAFLQGDVVVSAFLDAATGSAALVGLAATCMAVMPMVGQLFMGMLIHKVKVQSRLMAVLGFIDRPLLLLMVPLLMAGLNGPGAAAALLILYSLFFLIDGAISLLWIELCTRTLPERKRGQVISLQQTFSGLVGFGAGLLVNRILGSALSFEHQYAVIFSLSGLMLILDATVLALLKDVPHPSAPERPVLGLHRYLRNLVPLLTGNAPIRNVLVCRALYLLTLISAPINLVFGRVVGHLSAQQLALLVFMPVIGQTTAGLLWSQVCKRLGYPTMMLMAEGAGVLCALMNLLCLGVASSGGDVMLPLSITMVLIAINKPAYTGFTQQVVIMAPEEQRPSFIVLTGLVLAPMAFGTTLAGFVAERFGYLPVYLTMLLSGLLGFTLVFRQFFRPNSACPATPFEVES